MLTKMLRPAILISLAITPVCVGHAADMAIDCRLKGGTVVQLSAEACKLEGGSPADGNTSGKLLPPSDAASRATWTEAQKTIVDLLSKPVMDTTPLKRNPEGIERTAKFDGCRLVIDEILRIEYGNLFSTWKSFKINSLIDLQKIDREEFGVLGKVSSKGGDLKATAVSFEERKRKDGNSISISVLEPRNGSYEKYITHGPSAYWDAPRDDFWIADEYGYPKDNGWGNATTDKIRILLIVNSAENAAKLEKALEEVNTACKQLPVETKEQVTK
jgi:hypothetical protein